MENYWMVNKKAVLDYLAIVLISKYIIKAFMFGSFVTEKKYPNDCDVFIVTKKIPFTSDWTEFINLIDKIKNDFKKLFDLPLNVVINTEDEFAELSVFKERIRKKKTINIVITLVKVHQTNLALECTASILSQMNQEFL